MVPMLSMNKSAIEVRYGAEDRKLLLGTARESIVARLENRQPDINRGNATHLMQEAASFVSLHTYIYEQEKLRGCIGSLEAHRPLLEDVVDNAQAAAFRDPRFPSVSSDELDGIVIDISILSSPEPLQFDTEDDLLSQLRPGIDGLILEEGFRRGTFLPVVWEQLPEPEDFLSHLKLKAGMPAQHWSDAIKISRYTTESFGERDYL